jgi:integrase
MKTPVEPFLSSLSSSIDLYLELKQALGRRFTTERRVLHLLHKFMAETGAANLTETEFELWCKTQMRLSPTVRRNRMRIVRNFCLYRRRTEPNCFVPDQCLFPAPHQAIQPHIFSETEITRLLQATVHLHTVPRCPLRPQVFRLAIVLLYTTGLRRRELVRLTLRDYDQHEHALLVRKSKFHKSRYLPLSADACRELESYLAIRRERRQPMEVDSALLWNGYAHGRPYSGDGLRRTIHKLLGSTGVRKADGRVPRVHDFRHAFAVHALLRWYRAGVDLQAKLPLLATYMGHVSIASTEYYLRFVPELAIAASDRFCSRYGALVQPFFLGGAS